MLSLYSGFTNRLTWSDQLGEFLELDLILFLFVSAGCANIKVVECRALILQTDINQATYYYKHTIPVVIWQPAGSITISDL